MAKNYYFTYGSNGNMPYVGGWTVVEAENYEMACLIFRAVHPDKVGGYLNCSSVYSQEQFEKTSMFKDGNFGRRCWETITLTVEVHV